MSVEEKVKRIILVVALLVVFPGILAWADEEKIAPEKKPKDFVEYTLGEIVVRGERPGVADIAINTAVDAQEIEATHSKSAAEALSHVPGIQVTTGRKNEPNISIHGFDQSQTLVLIDGVPYYETAYGKLDLNQFSADNIARIDVTKGAPSVLYGPNALVGVVNIITKKPGDKPSIAASYEAAEKNGSRFALSHGMKIKKLFNYWLSYTHREWDAWRLSESYKKRPGEIMYRTGGPPATVTTFLEDGGYFRDNSDYKNDSFWAKAGLEFSKDTEYYVNYHYVRTEKGDPMNVDSARVFRARPSFSMLDRMEKYDDWGVDVSGRQKVTDWLSLQGKAFYHNHIDDYVSYWDETFNRKIAVSRYKDYILGGMVRTDFTPVEWESLRLAGHYKKDSHKERDDEYLPFAEYVSYTGSLAAENEFSYVRGLSIVAGASYDWCRITKAMANTVDNAGDFTGHMDLVPPEFMDEVNPMGGASYQVFKWLKVYGSVARKTRFPTLVQLFSTRTGNINLSAERSVNYTAGIAGSYDHIVKVDVAGFHHDIKDRITRDSPDPLGMYRNYAKIRMTGVEANVELSPFKDFLVKAGYTYIRARDRSADRVTDKVLYVPKHKIDARVQYTVPWIGTRIDVNVLHMTEQYDQLPTPNNPNDATLETAKYTIVGGKVTQPIYAGFEVHAAVENAFDRDYESQSGYPAPGRSIWGGATFRY